LVSVSPQVSPASSGCALSTPHSKIQASDTVSQYGRKWSPESSFMSLLLLANVLTISTPLLRMVAQAFGSSSATPVRLCPSRFFRSCADYPDHAIGIRPRHSCIRVWSMHTWLQERCGEAKAEENTLTSILPSRQPLGELVDRDYAYASDSRLYASVLPPKARLTVLGQHLIIRETFSR
jgi:hypothetical protein